MRKCSSPMSTCHFALLAQGVMVNLYSYYHNCLKPAPEDECCINLLVLVYCDIYSDLNCVSRLVTFCLFSFQSSFERVCL